MTTGTDRRGLLLAVLGCLLAAALALIALDLVWLRVDLPALAPQPASSQTFVGREVKGELLGPVGICFGAAALALLPSRRIGRLIVAVALLGAGLLLIAAIWIYLADGAASAAHSLAARSRPIPSAESGFVPTHELAPIPALLALLGGLIAFCVGLFTAVRASRWPVMGTRYERDVRSSTAADHTMPPRAGKNSPGQDSAPISESAMWAALDRGEDPTATTTPASAKDAGHATRDEPVPQASLE